MDGSMRAVEHLPVIDLPDARVAVCGDWHGNTCWLRSLAPAIRNISPDITTILQAGDWWMDLGASDRILKDAGIERVLVTLGNHEPWPYITPVLDAYPGEAVRVSERTWLLPRPYRFRIAGRQILSMGGATSVDRAWRKAGTEWWPDETITDAHVESALAGGPADVMITHETPAATPVRAVRELLRTNPFGFPAEALVDSATSRARITQVWDAVRPDLLLHGHMHVPGGGTTADGRRVISLGQDEQQGHLAFLDLATLTIETPSLRQIRDASARGDHTRHLGSR